MDSTIRLLPKSEISRLKLSSVAAQPDLCRTWTETLKNGFHTTRLISSLRRFIAVLVLIKEFIVDKVKWK